MEAVELGGSSLVIVVVIGVVAAAALLMSWMLRQQVLKAREGTDKMQEIAGAVQEGASAYLNRQLRTLAVFAAVVFALLFLLPGDTGVRIGRSMFFLLGAGCSATIGYMGMWLAVRANVRVAAAAREPGGRAEGARLAFRTGGAVGMGVVGQGLAGAAAVVFLFRENAPAVLEGFGFGAALLAMFMRVGGGIFTKAADVGADLVGKVENHIPEDDPRNAATIADNVGDNVGDCAGMAADLFESYAVTLVAALILGKVAFGEDGLIFPLIVTAVGALVAAIGVLITRVRQGESGLKAINRGFYLSALVGAVLSAVAAFVYLPGSFSEFTGSRLSDLDGDPRVMATIAVFVGIGLAGLILKLTGYFTDTAAGPTKRVAKTSLTGAATVVLSGVGVGLASAVYTATVIAGAVVILFVVSGGSLPLALFLVALAGCGLLTTVGVIVAMDTFGPVSDNAQGIAEMSGDVDEEAAQTLTDLDAVGNTTKAITKGIAIATAVLAATALFGSYSDAVETALASAGAALGEVSYEIINPMTLVGVIVGGATVFLFSGLAIDAVTRAAGAIVLEVRRQFREMPGIMTGEQRPEYGRVVDICTRDSLRELATPGLLAAMAPIFVGFGLGVGALAGFLAGAIGTGVLMAVFLANSGGSWDNAKKIVEDGHHGGKYSPAHEATIIGDTIGDPFKDTAGPAINPLIKVMNLVALLIAPAVVALSFGDGANPWLRWGIALIAAALAVAAVVAAERRAHQGDLEHEGDKAAESEHHTPASAITE
ncbi:sodium-translocating pyrophosphatase [Demequina sp. NBRC 110052]|uniref:sodium-translocating pyrophosphatase n=1 Tax=Demequina sp. NBRC 110052 TaxID=1570341 RepID=UPI000A05059A|nr:sodium-translocating pyrophosphatase [Demequina sp. NBRC 110052]